MFTWSADKIRFLKDASEYGRFNDVLAERAAAHFPAGAHVCDAGCGLGYLSLALAPLCGRVTALDVSNEALDVLRDNIARRGVQNIEVREADAFALPAEETFDAAALCFFGGARETLRFLKRHVTGSAVLFKKNWETHRFTLRETKLEKFTFRQTCEVLTRWGVPFETESFEVEMGQPFTSVEDAARFFRLNSRGAEAAPVDPAIAAARLVPIDSAAYPYYLPSCRPVGMIVIQTRDIPQEIENESEDT